MLEDRCGFFLVSSGDGGAGVLLCLPLMNIPLAVLILSLYNALCFAVSREMLLILGVPDRVQAEGTDIKTDRIEHRGNEARATRSHFNGLAPNALTALWTREL